MAILDDERLNIDRLHLKENQLRLLMDTGRYVDDTIIQAANILFKESFPAVAGFEDTLYRQRPQLRTRYHPTAANIYHLGKSEHFVATIYVAPNNILFLDSLHPGGKPSESVIKQLKRSYIFTRQTIIVDSIFVQKQTGVDCGAFSVANIWAVLSGMELRTTQFCEDNIRSELYTSFKKGKLFFNTTTCKRRKRSKSYRFKIV